MYAGFKENIPNSYKIMDKLTSFLQMAKIDVDNDCIYSYKAMFQASYKSTPRLEHEDNAGTMICFEFQREKNDHLTINSVGNYLEGCTKQFTLNLQGDQYEPIIQEKITQQAISGEFIYEKSCPCQIDICKGSRQFYGNPVCPYFYA